MKNAILALALILGFSPNVWAAVQTDTHTYIVSEKDNAALAINRQTGQETIIKVGKEPISMVIHRNMGYVVNEFKHGISVIDLKTNKVTQTIPVGRSPRSMVIHGDKGYVVNEGSNDVSVLDLKSNTVIHSITVGRFPVSMVIHEGVGYVMNHESNGVSVLDLSRNEVTKTIAVGRYPQSMVIHGGMGYVVNYLSNTISVIDLQTNAVTQTIPVGSKPVSMVIHGGMGYVVNLASNDVSVVDLHSNTVTQTIPVNQYSQSMVIYEGVGYVENIDYFTVLDLQTNRVATTFKNPDSKTIDFSDTHVYLGLKKYGPHYPTLASINLAKAEKTLGEFVAMMPEVFQLGEIEKRAFPKEANKFDTLPLYVLAQEIFWDLKTNEPFMDPKDILATLVTMKYPQKFLQTKAGAWLRNRLHLAFFQTVWSGDEDKAKDMLTYFVQLQDPVITKLATYTFKGAKKSSDQKATNSMDLN